MKVSYNWLQEYLTDKLPPVDEVVTALTMHSFEIEGVETKGEDKVLDVKVLPNRSHDCLSHYGIASEIASVLGLERKFLLPNQEINKTDLIKQTVTSKSCNRSVFVLIENAKISESPDWLKEKLAVLGHRSINSVVDITNYLTYSYGQPMHAFDANKISKFGIGGIEINIRSAKDGETITLLNDTEYKLDSSMMVIADGEKALDVAGVMGGKDSGVTESTTRILLSLSAFDAVSIRKTSKKLGVRTDASQRFENEIAPYLVDRALPYALDLILDLTKGKIVGKSEYYPYPQKEISIQITPEKISSILGLSLDASTIIFTLGKQKINAVKNDKGIIATAPLDRLDLVIEENIAEEVGRLYGLEKIQPVVLPESKTYEVNKEVYVSSVIRNLLIKEGFSEIYTYAFVGSGDVEVDNPLAGDKKFLRKNLLEKMEYSLEHNFKFLDLLGEKQVKLFEIGRVFRTDGEFLHLSLGIKFPKGKKYPPVDEEIAKTIHSLETEFQISFGDASIVGGVVELNLEKVMNVIKIPEKYPDELLKTAEQEVRYKPVSPYPFAVRDVAVFVPNSVSHEKVETMIKEKLTDIVVRFSVFDKFQKEEKTSYGFRLVFQAPDRTLTDEEINSVMNPIYEMLKGEEGFEIR